MENSTEDKTKSRGGFFTWLVTNLGRILISLVVPIGLFTILWQGFIFLRDSQAPQIVLVIVAIVWGVGGVAALYWVTNWLVEQLPREWTRRLQPFIFVGPALAISGLVSIHPSSPHSLILSFQK